MRWLSDMWGDDDMPDDADLDWTFEPIGWEPDVEVDESDCHDPRGVLLAIEWLLEASKQEDRLARELWLSTQEPYTPEAFAKAVAPDLNALAKLCREAAARGNYVIGTYVE